MQTSELDMVPYQDLVASWQTYTASLEANEPDTMLVDLSDASVGLEDAADALLSHSATPLGA